MILSNQKRFKITARLMMINDDKVKGLPRKYLQVRWSSNHHHLNLKKNHGVTKIKLDPKCVPYSHVYTIQMF